MSDGPITLELLQRTRAGDGDATRKLSELLYADLRRLAQAALGTPSSPPSIQATELVHEVYLRLARSAGDDWQNRAHFLAVAAKAMRQVLIDRARARQADKRGQGVKPLTLGGGGLEPSTEEHPMDVLDLESALERLAEFDARGADIVVCRLFAGMEVNEIAEALGVSRYTVSRSLHTARTWLARELDAERGA
ncbi:MAG: ECF-type sigma factor [Acidobacteriota bacterium]